MERSQLITRICLMLLIVSLAIIKVLDIKNLDMPALIKYFICITAIVGVTAASSNIVIRAKTHEGFKYGLVDIVIFAALMIIGYWTAWPR